MTTIGREACPTAVDLLDYTERRLSQPDADRIRDHSTACQFCRRTIANLADRAPGVSGASLGGQVPPALRDIAAEHGQDVERLLRTRRPAVPSFGDLWTTRLPDHRLEFLEGEYVQPRIVTVLLDAEGELDEGERILLVAPISLDTELRSGFDLIVHDRESPLGYEYMIEVWNEVSMTEVQLGSYLGSLTQPLKGYLGLVHQAYQGSEVDLSALADRRGPAIMHDEDPRVTFQEREIEACEYLLRPAVAAVLGPDTAPQTSFTVNGQAVKAAWQRIGLDAGQLVAALTQRGHSVTLRWILDLQRVGRADVTSGLAHALSEVLRVPLSDLQATSGAVAQDSLSKFLGTPFREIVRRWARQRGADPEEVGSWARERLVAAARRSEGQPDEAYWEQFLLSLLERRTS